VCVCVCVSVCPRVESGGQAAMGQGDVSMARSCVIGRILSKCVFVYVCVRAFDSCVQSAVQKRRAKAMSAW